MNLEADYGQGCTKDEREVQPERGHKRQQGAKLSNRPRHQPQPAEKRVGDERQPRPLTRDRQQGAKLSNRPRHQPQPAEKRVGDERQPRPLTRDREEPWRELRVTQR